mmetsp:Transcript_62738/g.166760  ORF Transcript_62738/g.166760 Transcript_62738/m.166760 type:complete len:222 (-) Transcript_62738:1697-2362(-)
MGNEHLVARAPTRRARAPVPGVAARRGSPGRRRAARRAGGEAAQSASGRGRSRTLFRVRRPGGAARVVLLQEAVRIQVRLLGVCVCQVMRLEHLECPALALGKLHLEQNEEQAGWCIFTLVSGQYAVLLTSVSAFGGWSFALGVQHVTRALVHIRIHVRPGAVGRHMQKESTRTDQTRARNAYGTCPSLTGQGIRSLHRHGARSATCGKRSTHMHLGYSCY